MTDLTERGWGYTRKSVRREILTIDGKDTNCVIETEFGKEVAEPQDEEIRMEIDVSKVPVFEVKKVNDWKYETSFDFPGEQRLKVSEWDYGEEAENLREFYSRNPTIFSIVNIYRQYGEVVNIENVIENKKTGITEITVW